MSGSTASQTGDSGATVAKKVGLRALVGSGDRIGRSVLPVLVLVVALNVLRPDLFDVGGPSEALRLVSTLVLACGVVVWLWSVVLILTKVPKHELITTGPFALVKHPLYAGVSLLVLPWLGFLFNTSLGLVLGVVMYAASRRYAPEEELVLSEQFGPQWDEYCDAVKMPWM